MVEGVLHQSRQYLVIKNYLICFWSSEVEMPLGCLNEDIEHAVLIYQSRVLNV